MTVSVCGKRYSRTAQRPWISRETLDLIEARDNARIACSYGLEMHLKKRFRQLAKKDHARWLDVMASSSSWHAIKQIRNHDHGPSKSQGRLRNMQETVVDSKDRAQTLADDFEQVQWRVPHIL